MASNYPIGWGYRCHTTFSNSTNIPNMIKIECGVQGEILNWTGEGDRRKCLVSMPWNGARGWVPARCLTIGGRNNRRFNNIKILTDVPPIKSVAGLRSALTGESNRWDRFVHGFLLGLKHQQGSPEFSNMLPAFIINRLNSDQALRESLDLIKSGTVHGFRVFSERQNGTVDDFCRDVPELTSNRPNLGGGVYVLVLRFEASLNRSPEIYGGLTQDFQNRLNGHRSPDQRSHSFKDRAQRDSKSLKMYPICWIDGNEDTKCLAEQTLICAMQSYHPNTLTLLKKDSNTITITDADRTNKYFQSNLEAALLTKLGTEVMRESGWYGVCERPSFGASVGLNIQSPVATRVFYSSKLIWVKQVVPKCMEQYRRIPCNTYQRGSGLSLELFKIGSLLNITTSLDAHPGLTHDTEISPIIELALGFEHPIPWARLPSLPIWDDYHYALRLGIAVEFEYPKGSGQTVRQYIQGYRTMAFHDDSQIGSLIFYSNAMSIIRYLTQVRRQQLYDWEADLGIARVKEAVFDAPTASLLYEEVVPDLSLVKAAPRLTPTQTIADILTAHGALCVNGPWQDFGNQRMNTGGHRTKCDGCVKFFRTEELMVNQKAECERSSATSNTCKRCVLWNRPCSWTVNVKNIPALVNCLIHPEKRRISSFKLGDRQLLWLPKDADGSTS